MAKKTGTPKTPIGERGLPYHWATENYKRWVREWLETRKPKMSIAELARRVKQLDADANASGPGLQQFFGSKDNPASASNTTLMPLINRVVGIAPPPVCDPTNFASQIRDAVTARWNQMSETEQDAMLALLKLKRQS